MSRDNHGDATKTSSPAAAARCTVCRGGGGWCGHVLHPLDNIVVDVLRWCRLAVGEGKWVLLFVGCLTSHQHASVSQGRVCSDNFTCCQTEIEVADQTFRFTRSQHADTGATSPSTDPLTPGAWQGNQCLSHWYDSTPKKSRRKRDSNPGSSALEP